MSYSMTTTLFRNIRFGRMMWIIYAFAGASIILVFLSLPRDEPRTDYNSPIEHIYRQNVLVNNYFENLIEKDLAKINPTWGKYGEPSYLEDVRSGDHGVAKMRARYAMNVNVSDRIPYNRKLPISRPSACDRFKYDVVLPKASVVIVSHNEPWSVLVRTLHSVVDRTHKELLKEIIIVDDGSVYPNISYSFLDKFEYYINTRLPHLVSLMRLNKQVGIVGARLKGARAATGDVLVFLDAHCEVNEGWLPPLLQLIKENRNLVVQPVVDGIHWDTFEYSPFTAVHHFHSGIFTWAGMFEWMEMGFEAIANRPDSSVPVKNAVMAGGVFAIDKQYFWEVGGYDDQMFGWGAENIEISIRVWTCGGSLQIVPCSTVGHVFRSFSPLDPVTGASEARESFTFNLLRTVKVWWDDYERLLFQFRPSFRNVDYGNISERQALRTRLRCRPFKWYLSNVMPKFVMDADSIHRGRIMSDTGFCLWHDTPFEASDSFESLSLKPCHPHLTGRQYFAISNSSQFRREYTCLAPHYHARNTVVRLRLVLCDASNAKWTYSTKDRTLIFNGNLECMDSVNGKYPTLQRCHPLKASQKWTFLDNSTLQTQLST